MQINYFFGEDGLRTDEKNTENQKSVMVQWSEDAIQILTSEISKLDRVFILAELSFEYQNASTFFGFELVRELRQKKVLNPIIIMSFFPKSFFITNRNQNFAILKTPGHYFVQLPALMNDLVAGEYEGIDKLTLMDINRHIFSLEGHLEEIFHGLKNFVLSWSQYPENTFEAKLKSEIRMAFSKVNDYSNDYNRIVMEVIEQELITNFQEEITSGNPRNFPMLIDNALNDLKKNYSQENPQELKTNTVRYPWKVLYVEDELNIAEIIKQKLFERGIPCELAVNYNQTLEILKSDKLNEITVVICDYRLLDENGSWQKEQGYKIIELINMKFNKLLSFFSLSSFDDSALLFIQQEYKIKVRSYPKTDVINSEEGFNIFAKKIIEEGDKVFDQICSVPKHKVWTTGYLKKFDKPFSYYYRHHRLAIDFANADKNIAEKAALFVLQIAHQKYRLENDGETELYSFQEGIGNDKKSTTLKEKIEKFRIKLIGRRISFALYTLLSLKKGQIYWALKTGTLGRDDESNTINQLFTTYLGLSFEKDIPNRLFPEEREWLEQMELKVKSLL
ncbi:MAG: response regulator [Bacteroidota bacterium]